MYTKLSKFAMAFAMAAISVAFSSCKDEEEGVAKISAKINMIEDVEGSISADEIKGAKITLTSTQSKDVYTFTVPANIEVDGTSGISVSVPIGTYDISLEKTVDGKTIFLRQENVTIKEENQTIVAKLITTVANSSDFQFIFSEVFFNGERNAGRMMRKHRQWS